MPEITKTETANPSALPRYVWLLLALLAVVVYFFGLTLPFLGPDEARYAQVAREMFDRGDWITPTLGGFNWFEKPALLYWIEIASYWLFGVSEFAARFGPTLFGLGTIASLWIVGRKLATENTETAEKEDGNNSSVISGTNEFANYLALIAASTLGILVFSRGASFDIIITFPITAAMVSFFIFDMNTATVNRRADKKGYLPLILFYVFIGVALLAKGLIGIVFPFAIVGLYYLLARRLPNRLFVVSLIWGTLLAVAVAAIWYVPMYQRHGWAFIDEFFIQHHFQRFTSNKFQHPQPFYFFLWVLPLMTLPWLSFLIGAVWKYVKALIRPSDAEAQRAGNLALVPSSPLLLFSIAWVAVPLLFFSFSGSKLPGYILPAVPGAIVFTSVFVFSLARKSKRWRNVVIAKAIATFVLSIVVLIFALPPFAESDSVRTLIQTAHERGFTSNHVLMLHTVSHNAEFYAAGRLQCDGEGKLRRLYGVAEVRAEIDAEGGKPVLVLVPLEYVPQLTTNSSVRTEILKDNGELAIAAVSANQ